MPGVANHQATSPHTLRLSSSHHKRQSDLHAYVQIFVLLSCFPPPAQRTAFKDAMNAPLLCHGKEEKEDVQEKRGWKV